MIRVTTRHPEDFDILSTSIDPSRSPYAKSNPLYLAKLKTLYEKLTVQAAVWTTPQDQPPEFFEEYKSVEYLLEIEPERIIAYVDEWTWSTFLAGQCQDFKYSLVPARYRNTSILVAVPLRADEVKEIRRYRCGPRRNRELIDRRPWKKS